MLSDADVAARLPAWCALSELFVDTEFDAAARDRMVDALRATGLPVASLDRILRDEVAPVFHANVFAGNWTGWTDEEVRRLVTAHLARQDGAVARLARPLRPLLDRVRMAGFEADWSAVKARLADPG